MSALTELFHALRNVEGHLEQARGHLIRSQRSLTAAEAALAQLDPNNPELVVPPGLHHANDQIERALTTVDHVGEILRGFADRL